MKKIIFLTIFTFCTFSLSAQKIIKNSIEPELKEIKFSFAHNENTIAIQEYIADKSQGYIISILDVDLNSSQELIIESSNGIIRSASLVDDKLYLLFQENKAKQNVIDYNLMTINLNDFSKSSKQIHSLNQANHETIGRFFYQNSSEAELGRIDESIDKKYISLSIESRINKLKTKSITVLFFNSKYELLYKNKFTHTWDKNDGRFQYKSSFINSEKRSLVVLNHLYNANKYKIEIVNQDGYEIKDFEFKNKNPKTLQINGKGDSFYCAGFYFSDKKKVKDGIFYSKFSNELELLIEKNIDFSQQLLEQDQSKKQKKKGFTAIASKVGASFKATHLLLNDESNLFLLGEIRISLNNSNAYDDVAVVKLTSNGDLEWSRLVDKSQHLVMEKLSFKPFFISNNLNLLFNSAVDFDDLGTDAKTSRLDLYQPDLKKANLYLVSFAQNGDFEYKQLTDKKNDVNYSVRESDLLENNSMILRGFHRKENSLIKIDFNK